MGQAAPVASAPEPLPESLADPARFRLVKLIDANNHSAVYTASDAQQQDGGCVAVKQARKNRRLPCGGVEPCGDPNRELAVYTRLREQKQKPSPQKHIVQCIAFKETETHIEFVLEYCETDLCNVLQRLQPSNVVSESIGLPVTQAQKWFSQLVSAVHYLHVQLNVAHLDISPENILFAKDSTLKLADFGASRPFDKGQRLWLRSAAGKWRYLCPEIYALRKTPCATVFDGGKADVWSLGIVLFHMLAGFPPLNEPCENDARFNCIMDGRLAFMAKAWGLVVLDSELVELLSHMLCAASERWTIKQLSEHPWVAAAAATRVDKER